MLEVAPCRRRSLQKTTEVPDNRHATPSLEMQTSSHAASPNLTRLPPGRTRRHDAASTLESRPGRSLRKTGVLGNGNSRRPVLQYGDRTFLRIPREILTLVRAVDQAASSLVVLRNTVTKTDPVDAPSPACSRTCHTSRLRPGVARVRRHTQGAAREQHGLATDPDPKYASFRLPRASEFHDARDIRLTAYEPHIPHPCVQPFAKQAPRQATSASSIPAPAERSTNRAPTNPMRVQQPHTPDHPGSVARREALS